MAHKWSGKNVIADLVLIEKSSSGFPLTQELRQTTSLTIMGVNASNDKQTRMFNETPAMEAGRVHYDRTADWAEAFIRELLLFPNAKHDDQVDSLSQFLYWARVRGSGPP
jgi:predicted phage terminase large subunit-like protein